MLSLVCLALETAAAAAVFAPTQPSSRHRGSGTRARRYGQIQTLFAGAGLDYPLAHVLLRP